jgi:hypothetical protein
MKVSAQVHYNAGADGGLVLLDARTGQWYVLNAVAADLWHSWSRGLDLDASAATVATRHADVPFARIHADARLLLTELTELDLIRPEQTPLRPARPAARPDADPFTAPTVLTAGRRLRLDIAAAVALVLATVLVRLPFGPLSRIVGGTRRWCGRPETIASAELLGRAVRHVGAWFPWQAACMELSLATVLLAAARRRRVDWCLGALLDPYRFHAWVETEGHRVRLPGDPATEDYVPVLVV